MGKHLQNEVIDCPICGQVHEVGLYSRMATIEVKGVEVDYEQQYYACPNIWPESKEGEFCFGSLWQANIARAKEAYAKKIQQG